MSYLWSIVNFSFVGPMRMTTFQLLLNIFIWFFFHLNVFISIMGQMECTDFDV